MESLQRSVSSVIAGRRRGVRTAYVVSFRPASFFFPGADCFQRYVPRRPGAGRAVGTRAPVRRVCAVYAQLASLMSQETAVGRPTFNIAP